MVFLLEKNLLIFFKWVGGSEKTTGFKVFLGGKFVRVVFEIMGIWFPQPKFVFFKIFPFFYSYVKL